VYLGLAAIVVIVALAYPHYFRWWDGRSCRESGGSWSETQDKCIEPRNTDIPNTEKPDDWGVERAK
jgi:hypothetical protein